MGQFIGVSIAVFLVIILVLVAMLLIAKKYLSPSGKVTIPSRKEGQGLFIMEKASKRPMSIQLVMIRPTYTRSCTLTS